METHLGELSFLFLKKNVIATVFFCSSKNFTKNHTTIIAISCSSLAVRRKKLSSLVLGRKNYRFSTFNKLWALSGAAGALTPPGAGPQYFPGAKAPPGAGPGSSSGAKAPPGAGPEYFAGARPRRGRGQT